MDSFKLELMPLGVGWKASASKAIVKEDNDFIETIDFCGSAEEAVANLWLKLKGFENNEKVVKFAVNKER